MALTLMDSVPLPHLDDHDYLENAADLYSIFVACEVLEKAFIRDAVAAEEYTPACTKLIAQFKTCMTSLGTAFDVKKFVKEHEVKCPAAVHRLLEVGVPATTEHLSVAASGRNGTHNAVSSSGPATKYVVEAVQFFITLMDAVKINQVAVDQLHPMLGDLLRSLNRVPQLDQQGEVKQKLKAWLIDLNKMRASDELSVEQARQFLFDLEYAHSQFCQTISE